MTAVAASHELSAAPELSAAEIRRELESIFTKDRRSSMAAIWGRGEPGEIELKGATYRVIPTQCELELRILMPEGSREDERLLFLVDWSPSLPLDVASRLAGGKVFRPARDRRLAVLFGAQMAEPGLTQSALARLILGGEITGLEGTATGQVLRRVEAYRLALNELLGLPAEGDLPLGRLTPWCVRNHDGPAFAARGGADWEVFRHEVQDFIGDLAGPVGSVAWLAWERNLGQRFVELVLILDALMPSLGSGSYAEGLLRGKLGELAPGFGDALLDAAKVAIRENLADQICRILRDDSPKVLRGILQSADRLIGDANFRMELARSHRLPAGYEHRIGQLSASIEDVLKSPSLENLATLRMCHDAVEQHELSHDESLSHREGRRMLARLAAYLVYSATQPTPAIAGAPYQEALDLAHHYRLHGGWVDMARRFLRGWEAPGLGDVAVRLLAEVDRRRRQDDRQFAKGIVAWLSAGRPGTQALPIAAVSKRLAGEFLNGKEERKLLVVLVDGMSWADAVDLVPSLQRESGRWNPAAWKPKGFKSAADPLLPPVFAALPTLTQVSRAAFFAGKDLFSFGNEPTAKDRERWAANKAIREFFDEDEGPVVLLKDRVISEGGLHEDARKLVRSDHRIVAVVVNTIDEQLGGSAQAVIRSTVDHVRPLSDLLIQAEHAGRAVLLVSDHGHVPGAGMKSAGPSGDGGRRWRPLRESDVVQPFEIELPIGEAWCPPGCRAVAAVVEDSVCYGQPQAGEHGGLTLAEMVAPALLLVPDTMCEETGDAELAQVMFDAPEWWRNLTAPGPAGAGDKPAAKVTGPKQISFIREEPPRTDDKDKPFTPSLVTALLSSGVFKAHISGLPKERVSAAVSWLEVLVEAGGQLEESEFASRINVPAYRVAGAAARLAEVLNLDGYAVVKHSLQGRQVRVDLELLRQLFELGS